MTVSAFHQDYTHEFKCTIYQNQSITGKKQKPRNQMIPILQINQRITKSNQTKITPKLVQKKKESFQIGTGVTNTKQRKGIELRCGDMKMKKRKKRIGQIGG